MLQIRETYVNETKGYQFGNSGWQDTDMTEKGKIFLAMQREFGRCVSGVFVDKKDGTTEQVGWVFEKKMKYEDARSNKPEDFYIRQVWVELRRQDLTYGLEKIF